MYLPYQSFKYRSSKNELIHFFNKLNEDHFKCTFHQQYKYPGTFATRKYEQLSYPKNPKMCHPILVTLLEMQPHYGQSSRENATPSRGTPQLASYKEAPPCPPAAPKLLSRLNRSSCCKVVV